MKIIMIFLILICTSCATMTTRTKIITAVTVIYVGAWTYTVLNPQGTPEGWFK